MSAEDDIEQKKKDLSDLKQELERLSKSGSIMSAEIAAIKTEIARLESEIIQENEVEDYETTQTESFFPARPFIRIEAKVRRRQSSDRLLLHPSKKAKIEAQEAGQVLQGQLKEVKGVKANNGLQTVEGRSVEVKDVETKRGVEVRGLEVRGVEAKGVEANKEPRRAESEELRKQRERSEREQREREQRGREQREREQREQREREQRKQREEKEQRKQREEKEQREREQREQKQQKEEKSHQDNGSLPPKPKEKNHEEAIPTKASSPKKLAKDERAEREFKEFFRDVAFRAFERQMKRIPSVQDADKIKHCCYQVRGEYHHVSVELLRQDDVKKKITDRFSDLYSKF